MLSSYVFFFFAFAWISEYVQSVGTPFPPSYSMNFSADCAVRLVFGVTNSILRRCSMSFIYRNSRYDTSVLPPDVEISTQQLRYDSIE